MIKKVIVAGIAVCALAGTVTGAIILLKKKQPTTKCVNDSQCPTGEKCNTVVGVCQPYCATNMDCVAPKICRNNQCVNQCVINSDCATGQKCVDNKCIVDEVPPSQCVYTSDCPIFYSCQNGKCVQGCINDNDCAAGQKCFDGKCVAVDCLTSDTCKMGEYCASSGKCKGFEEATTYALTNENTPCTGFTFQSRSTQKAGCIEAGGYFKGAANATTGPCELKLCKSSEIPFGYRKAVIVSDGCTNTDKSVSMGIGPPDVCKGAGGISLFEGPSDCYYQVTTEPQKCQDRAKMPVNIVEVKNNFDYEIPQVQMTMRSPGSDKTYTLKEFKY